MMGFGASRIGLGDPQLTANHPWYARIAAEHRAKAEKEEEEKEARKHNGGVGRDVAYDNCNIEGFAYKGGKEQGKFGDTVRTPAQTRNLCEDQAREKKAQQKLAEGECEFDKMKELNRSSMMASTQAGSTTSLGDSFDTTMEPGDSLDQLTKGGNSSKKLGFSDSSPSTNPSGTYDRSSTNKAATNLLGMSKSEPNLKPHGGPGAAAFHGDAACARGCSRCGHRPGSRAGKKQMTAAERDQADHDARAAKEMAEREKFAVDRQKRRESFYERMGEKLLQRKASEAVIKPPQIGLFDPALTAKHPWYGQMARAVD